MPDQLIASDTTDRAYFTVTPNLLWALCRDAYDLAVWLTIKLVAGDSGECILSAEDGAALTGISVGKWVDSRQHLLAIGALTGEIKRDPGYPQPVWHLRIPDLWPANIRWREETGDSLKARIADIRARRQSLHHMKALLEKRREPSPPEGLPSPGEGYPSPHEGMPSPGEAKKNHIEEPKEEPKEEVAQPAKPPKWDQLLRDLRAKPELHSTVVAYLEPAEATLTGATLTIRTVSYSAATTVQDRLGELIRTYMTHVTRRRLTIHIVGPDQ